MLHPNGIVYQIMNSSSFARKKPQMKLNRLAHKNQINLETHKKRTRKIGKQINDN